MKFSATITKVLPPRTFSNEKGDFTFQPIEVEILEDCKRFDNTTFVREHNIKVDLMGKFAENFKLNPGTEITIDLVFDLHEKDGRSFQNIRSNYIALR